MDVVKEWLVYFKDQERDHEQRLKNVESRIDEVGEVLAYMQQTTPHQENNIVIVDDTNETPISSQPPLKILDDLTETQKAMFYRLGTLLAETAQQWITSKALAQELYPEKPYSKVRSTLSEYTSILIEAGLFKKQRKGKLTYLSITEKGVNLFEKTKKQKLKKVIINSNK